MEKKLILFFFVCATVSLVLVGIFILFHRQTTDIDPILSQDTNPNNLSNNLVSSFKTAMAQADIPKESIFMVDSYSGNSDNLVDVAFENKENNKKFYMASSIKPFYLAAYINLLGIDNLNYKVPFKFAKDAENKFEIASAVYQNITYGYQQDELIMDFIVPYFKDKKGITIIQIFDDLTTDPIFLNYSFSLRDIIKYTLGPSSNWSLTLIRNDFSLKIFKGDEEKSTSAIEDYLNLFLSQNNQPPLLHINLSTNSKKDKMFNTLPFNEVEYLFNWFYQNKFNLNNDIFELMKLSTEDVSIDPKVNNRSHEIKSIAKDLFTNKKALIMEKSGYIGFDYEAAPGLNIANGWDKLPQIKNKRIVFFDACAFSRIYLKNGKFVQFNYNISAPVYISLNPKYEELNQDYLLVKNNILNKLNLNLKSVLETYRDNLQT